MANEPTNEPLTSSEIANIVLLAQNSSPRTKELLLKLLEGINVLAENNGTLMTIINQQRQALVELNTVCNKYGALSKTQERGAIALLNRDYWKEIQELAGSKKPLWFQIMGIFAGGALNRHLNEASLKLYTEASKLPNSAGYPVPSDY